MAVRGHDFYPTPIEAIKALIKVERRHLPNHIWEPAAGDGAIADPLADAGFTVSTSDIVDRGRGYVLSDYLTSKVPEGACGIVTNPPFNLLNEFIEKALNDVPYSAWLCRINVLESVRRLPLFRSTPPARIWVSSRRLPMMHRGDWEGRRTSSNMCFCWAVWDSSHDGKTEVDWFDWLEAA